MFARGGSRTDDGSPVFWTDLGLRSPSTHDRSEISQFLVLLLRLPLLCLNCFSPS
jgi:hypothetical protein